MEISEPHRALKEVILEEVQAFSQKKSASELNEEFLKSNNSIRGQLIGIFFI